MCLPCQRDPLQWSHQVSGVHRNGSTPIFFEAAAVSVDGITSEAPVIHYERDGARHELRCDVVAGCDGSHGVSREAIPAGALAVYEKEYPVAWLGILAEAPPSTEELIYAYHDRGFALHSMRSPRISRLYLQCPPDDTLEAWPETRIWSELHARFEKPGWSLAEGPILETSITTMRSHLVEPMQHGRLFLAGDAAHIVPPTGAKGLNLAVADVRVLAEALVAWYREGRTALLEAYSATCLGRVWQAEHFSWWMTSMLHPLPGDGPFEHRLRLAQLRYVTSSRAAATSLAERYVGYEGAERGRGPIGSS